MIRQAGSADDVEWVCAAAAAAYRALGDYHVVVGAWLETPGVYAFIDAVAGERRGFYIVGFFAEGPDSATAELLALAVEPAHRRGGVGRGLLDHAIEFCRNTAIASNIEELRLTVAVDNGPGRHLYGERGFRVIDENHGQYDGGQRAIRMALRLH